jgi:hypothetical protein
MMKSDQLTLFQQDGPASLYPKLALERVQRITVASGLKLSDLSPNSGPLGLLVKMLLASKQWASMTYSLTWTGRAINPKHSIFRLRASVLDTNDDAFSSLPTPIARDWKDSEAPVFRNGIRQKDTLGRVIGGTPHPEFVEEVMGYPIGWTDLED